MSNFNAPLYTAKLYSDQLHKKLAGNGKVSISLNSKTTIIILSGLPKYCSKIATIGQLCKEKYCLLH